MIPYEELVMALAQWRARQGLPQLHGIDYLGAPQQHHIDTSGAIADNAVMESADAFVIDEAVAQLDAAEQYGEQAAPAEQYGEQQPAYAEQYGEQQPAYADPYGNDPYSTPAAQYDASGYDSGLPVEEPDEPTQFIQAGDAFGSADALPVGEATQMIYTPEAAAAAAEQPREAGYPDQPMPDASGGMPAEDAEEATFYGGALGPGADHAAQQGYAPPDAQGYADPGYVAPEPAYAPPEAQGYPAPEQTYVPPEAQGYAQPQYPETSEAQGYPAPEQTYVPPEVQGYAAPDANSMNNMEPTSAFDISGVPSEPVYDSLAAAAEYQAEQDYGMPQEPQGEVPTQAQQAVPPAEGQDYGADSSYEPTAMHNLDLAPSQAVVTGGGEPPPLEPPPEEEDDFFVRFDDDEEQKPT